MRLGVLCDREVAARKGLMAALTELAGRVGVPVVPTQVSRDPRVMSLYTLEAAVETLQAIVEAMPAPEPPADAAPAAPEPSAEPVAAKPEKKRGAAG